MVRVVKARTDDNYEGPDLRNISIAEVQVRVGLMSTDHRSDRESSVVPDEINKAVVRMFTHAYRCLTDHQDISLLLYVTANDDDLDYRRVDLKKNQLRTLEMDEYVESTLSRAGIATKRLMSYQELHREVSEILSLRRTDRIRKDIG